MACEHAKSDNVKLKCPSGKRIDVLFANYGRIPGGKSGCKKLKKKHVKKCISPKSLAIVKAKCQGRQFCSVKAANSVFGDPCSYVKKYLVVRYTCVRRELLK